MGCEPTGYYCFNLAHYLNERHIKLALVNPYHVKQIKELDDNSPKKTDLKEPKTIAKLVMGGRYSYPYLPEGIYADLREAVSSRDRIVKELNAAMNWIKRWLKIYFPEYLTVYKSFSAESGLTVLETAPLQEEWVLQKAVIAHAGRFIFHPHFVCKPHKSLRFSTTAQKYLGRVKSLRADNIDILKAICAFLIVCIHIPFPGTVGAYFTALTRSAVPIFFMITGYFYSDVVKRGEETRQIRKIMKLVIEANLIYLVWDSFYALVSRNMDFFQSTFTLKNLLKFLLLNESPLKGHLWYLGAILYVLIIVRVADKLKCGKMLYFLTPVLLLGDLVFGKYSIVIWGREFPYIFVRNFLFVGIPYFCIGQLIRRRGTKNQKEILSCLIVIFSLTSIYERLLLDNIGMNATRDHYISTTFLAGVVFLFALKCNGTNGLLATVGRKYSTWVYIMHPIFITCFGTVAQKAGIYGVYHYIAPIVVYITTLIFLMVAARCWNIIERRQHR